MLSVPIRRPPRSRLFTCLLVLTGLLLAGGVAFPAGAQQPDSVEADTTAREAPTRPVASTERKSPGRAVLYSAGGTALLLPLAGVGLIWGPSFGHFYAEDSRQAWIGIGIRAGGFLLIGIGGLAALGGQGQAGFESMALGALTVGGSAGYDIVTAWDSATDYNEAHGFSAQVAPTVGPRGEQVGLALRVSF